MIDLPPIDVASIVGGMPEAGEPAVVAVVAQAPVCGEADRVYCSGTLIAPRAVLTARHCIDVAPPGGIVVVTGPDARDSAAPRIAVIATFMAPDDDVALLALATPLTANPAPLRQTPLDAALVGASVRVVGYGFDDLGMLGVKRSGDATIEEIAPRVFRIVPGPALSCDGDSGGPVFLGAELAGVTSFGDSACESSGTNVRVDLLIDTFFAPTLAAIAALPTGDGTPLVPDEDLCTRACVENRDCPADFACVDSPGGGPRACGFLGMPPGRLGAPCDPAAASGCDGVCVPDPTGQGCRCYQACAPEDTGDGGCGVARVRRREPVSALLLLAAWALIACARRTKRRGA